ncbi:MAG: FkbM family methyltransferase [Cryomorphaceae bacterium]|nr:MAG: FkbM family methyltransferase [Cryomorphaceae bacterium]
MKPQEMPIFERCIPHFMPFQKLKLRLRARKYQRKTDPGGIAFLRQTLLPGQCAFDIGAHRAGYLYHMMDCVGSSGYVHAFEPQSALYDYISRVKPLMGWQNLRLEHLALSDRIGKVTLHIPVNKVNKGSSPGASIVEGVASGEIALRETVPMDTLDGYCERNKVIPDFLKVDVEGNELNVFKGGAGVLLEHKPAILVEIEERHIGRQQMEETFQWLRDCGYEGHFIRGHERLPLSAFSVEQHQDTRGEGPYCNNFTFTAGRK